MSASQLQSCFSTDGCTDERAAETVLAIYETLTLPRRCHSFSPLGSREYRRMDFKGKFDVFGKDAPLPRPPIRWPAGPRTQISWTVFSCKSKRVISVSSRQDLTDFVLICSDGACSITCPVGERR
ncbi:hypothetical protein J6590_076946 [Homalodisca vitripennis]|nr:hypothetical protein J6590_076946 [Homalodisca vitripennis]